jgi:hypothetical protein
MVARLERLKLREAFPSEVKDFSRWLHENIDELGRVLGLELSNPGKERPAGDFSVDLIAEDAEGGIVIIENQLGRSDHDHLGKVLTYLTAFEAKAAIWIMETPRVEHVNAMAWLNQSSSADFYMVKLEAVRIGDSDVAPLMTLIVGPSEDTKIITEEKQEIVARYGERRKFWEGLLPTANAMTTLHAGRSPTKDSWISSSAGKRGIDYTYVIRQHDVQVEVWISRGSGQTVENKHIFDTLAENKDQIQTVFGSPQLEWQRLDEKEGCRIRAVSSIGGYRDPEKWPDVFSWMTDRMIALDKAFRPYINALKI